MNLKGFNHYIVFYTTVNHENTLQHLVGFQEKPDINDTHHALVEFTNEFLPNMNLDVPVYMIYMNELGIKELFGFTGD